VSKLSVSNINVH